MDVSAVLTESCGYDHPAIGLQAVIKWSTDAPGVRQILTEMESFRFEPENIVDRVLFSHFVTFCSDKLARPEFSCWPGVGMPGDRAGACLHRHRPRGQHGAAQSPVIQPPGQQENSG